MKSFFLRQIKSIAKFNFGEFCQHLFKLPCVIKKIRRLHEDFIGLYLIELLYRLLVAFVNNVQGHLIIFDPDAGIGGQEIGKRLSLFPHHARLDVGDNVYSLDR